MWTKINLFKYLAVVTLAVSCAIAGADAVVYVSQVQSGVYQVYDPATDKTVFVRDVEAYLKTNYQKPKVDGFGKKLSQKEFAKGTNPVTETAAAIAVPVNAAANTAYNTANLVPSWRKYTIPLRTALGLRSKNSNRQ